MASRGGKLNVKISADTRQFQRSVIRLNAAIDKFQKKSTNNFRKVNREARKMQKVMRIARRSMVSLATIYIGVRFLNGLAQINDQMIEMNNRLRLVTDSEQAAIKTRRELYEISQKTRSSLIDNVKFYAKVKLATENLNYTDKQRLRLVETINKQVQIGGSTTTEANAGLIQFAQGLASGTLRGDELRSVLEQLQGVSVGLIEGFRKLRQDGEIDINVTRANIRALASEGKLTSDLLIKATLKQAAATDKAFEKVQIKAADVGTKIKTEWVGAVDAFSKMTGFGDRWLGTLTNIEGVIRTIKALMEGMTEYDTFDEAFNATREALQNRLNVLQRHTPQGSAYGQQFVSQDRIDELQRILDALEKKQRIATKWDPLIDEQARRKAEKRREEQRIAGASIALGTEATGYAESIETPTATYKRKMAHLRDINATDGALSAKKYNLLIEKYMKERIAAQNAINSGLERELGVYDKITPVLDQFQAKLAKIDAMVKSGHITPQWAKHMKGEAFANFPTPTPEDMEDLIPDPEGVDRFTDAMKTMNEVMQSTLEDSFVEMIQGTKSVEEAFKNMATAVLAELYRIAVARPLASGIATALEGGVQALLGWGSGGGAATPAPTGGVGIHPPGLASGGQITRGRPTMVGENGREIFVPSSSGRVLSHGQAMNAVREPASGGGVNITQNLNFSVGITQTVREEVQRMLPTIANTAKNALIEEKQRGGVTGRAFR